MLLLMLGSPGELILSIAGQVDLDRVKWLAAQETCLFVAGFVQPARSAQTLDFWQSKYGAQNLRR